MKELLPGEADGWKADGEAVIYDRETIFDYMNGAGEIYRMFGYRKMAVLRMVRAGQPGITVELFDMGSPEDAYGVFSHSREQKEGGIGQGSYDQTGLLCFWKDRYFVCLRADEETPAVKHALNRISGMIEKQITAHGTKPDLLGCLPAEGMDIETVRYFHLFTSLNYHYYLAERNLLNLSERTEAVLAAYGPGDVYLLCVRYPGPEEAEAAYRDFIAAFIPEAGPSGEAQVENGKWVAAATDRQYVIIVFDAADLSHARALIEGAKKRTIKN